MPQDIGTDQAPDSQPAGEDPRQEERREDPRKEEATGEPPPCDQLQFDSTRTLVPFHLWSLNEIFVMLDSPPCDSTLLAYHELFYHFCTLNRSLRGRNLLKELGMLAPRGRLEQEGRLAFSLSTKPPND